MIKALYPGITPAAAAGVTVPRDLDQPPASIPGGLAPGTVKGTRMTDIPEVLFVCTHNAGRSQMAAALLDHRPQAGPGHLRRIQPASELNPAVVQAMAEVGLDISREFPKPLTTGKVQAADIVITMGCGDACPVYPGKRYLDWDLPDPAGLGWPRPPDPRRDSAAVRALVDELARHPADEA